MMIASGAEYHRHTGYDRNSLGGPRFLDWTNQPNTYKEYPGLKTTAISRDISHDAMLSRIIGEKYLEQSSADFSFEHLCSILGLTYTLTGKTHHSGGGVFFHRSVPSAGGLYPCELYMASRSVPGLESGLYHYAMGQHVLEEIRTGNFNEKGYVLTFFITVIFFRSAWKYRDRAYRYHLLDSGHLIENLVLTLKSLNLPFESDYDFDDERVNHLLGLDPEKEVCLAVVRVPGSDSDSGAETAEKLPERFYKASKMAFGESSYPAVEEIHRNTARGIISRETVPDMLSQTGILPHSWIKIPSPDMFPEKMNYSQAIQKRRSLRNFVKTPLPKIQFEALIAFLCADDLTDDTLCTGFLSGNVEGLEPGCYWLNRSESSAGQTQTGILTDNMAHICLNQEWLSQAALLFFFVTNLKYLEQTFGTRGYRHAMLTAGRLGQRLYLAATVLELGCCGIGAFYDKEAGGLLELNEDSEMLYLVAAGPVKKFD